MSSKEKNGSAASLSDVVDAIQDLTRVLIATSGRFETKADAIRQLHELSVPSSRIAAILAMKSADVASTIAKHKKKAQGKGGKADKGDGDNGKSELLDG
jgi:hypothetical protein